LRKSTRRAAVAGLAAAVAVRPRRVTAAGAVTVWWTQALYKAENDAAIAAMTKWEKETGNKVEPTIANGPDPIGKTIAAMQVGDVPDLVHAVTEDRFFVPLVAWNDKPIDVSDAVASKQAEFSRTSLESARFLQCRDEKTLFLYGTGQMPEVVGTGLEANSRGGR
jgi:multiple sugar transport system substrate-binding protein